MPILLCLSLDTSAVKFLSPGVASPQRQSRCLGEGGPWPTFSPRLVGSEHPLGSEGPEHPGSILAAPDFYPFIAGHDVGYVRHKFPLGRAQSGLGYLGALT